MSKYLYLPGTNGVNASTPDHSSLDIAGDIDLRARIAPDDWSPSGQKNVLYKTSNSATTGYGFGLSGGSNGLIWMTWDPTSGGVISTVSNTAVSFAYPDVGWIRVTLDVSEYTVTYYTSTDQTNDYTAVTWAQLGTTDTGTGPTDIETNALALLVGGQGPGGFNAFVGRVYRAVALNGIGGTVAADFNADDFQVGDSGGDTAVDSTGKTWTINGATAEIRSDGNRLLLLGVG